MIFPCLYDVSMFIIWIIISMACGVSAFPEFSSLGCWKANQDILDLPIKASNVNNKSISHNQDIVHKCAQLAKSHGYSFFGVRDHVHCGSGVHVGLTYAKHGPSPLCLNGTGAIGAISIYSLEGTIGIQELDAETDNNLTVAGPDNQILPSDDRSMIELKPQTNKTQEGTIRSSLLPGALLSSLYTSGVVKPISIEPLFEEIDELKYGRFIHVPIGNNMLSNPSFELPLQQSPLSGWSCQGETDDPRGGALSRYSDQHGVGMYSGICYARLSEWAGPGQYIGRKVRSSGVYSFTGWTKLLDPKNTNDFHSLELWLRLKKRGQENKVIMRLARRDKFSTNTGWVLWKTSFQMPWSPKGYRYVFLFFSGPNKLVNILADDMELVEVMQYSNWKQTTDKLIEKHRKRQVKLKISIAPSISAYQNISLMKVKVEQKNHKFGFGAAVNTHSLIHNRKYKDFFVKHFEWAVMENKMKWTSTEPTKDQLVYKSVDKALGILEKHNISLRGHCVYWAVPTQTPSWLTKLSKRQLFLQMRKRITDLLERYIGKFHHWDVNNEMLHGSYFADRLGKSIREWMFKKANELDPDADLFINDFDVIENGQLTEVLVEQVKEFIDRGVDIGGIGVQGHFTGSINPFLLRLRLNALSEVGRPIWLTEVDVLDKDPVKRADSLEALLRVAFSHPNVHGVILWAFWETNSWRGRNVALVDGNWQLNAAGQRYTKLLNQWTTQGVLKPQSLKENEAEVHFSGFHGDYEVTAILPDGTAIKKDFTLEPGHGIFELKIDIDNQLDNLPLPDREGFSQQLAGITNQLNELLKNTDSWKNPEPNQRLPGDS